MRHRSRRTLLRTGLGLAAALTAFAVAVPSAAAQSAPPSPSPSPSAPKAKSSPPSPAPSTPTSASPKNPATPGPANRPPADAKPAPAPQPLAPDLAPALAKAKSTHQAAEIPSLTTEKQRTLVKPDGTLRSETRVHPVRVKQNGVWTDIDTTLVKLPYGTLAPKAAAGTAVFSGGGTGPAVSMTHGDQRLDLFWPSPLPQPVLSGPTATYPDLLPGVDLKLTATADAYSEVLVVRDVHAAALPALKTLHFTATGTNLSVRGNSDGSLSALDAGGAEVFRSPPAMMWDSSVDPRIGPTPSETDPGSGRLSKVDVAATPRSRQSTDIALHVPDAALTGPNTHYPLFIDPLFSARDKTYWESVDNQGYNIYNDNSWDARVGFCSYAIPNQTTCRNDVVRSIFVMDTSAIQSRNGVKANLTSATFNITQKLVAKCDAEPTNIWETGLVDGSTTWPGPFQRYLSSASSSAGGCGASPANVPFDVTSGIQDAIDHNTSTLTLGLVAPDESNWYEWKRFDNNPELDIDYDFPPNGTSGLYVSGEFACNGVNYVNNPTNFWVNAVATDNNPNPLPLDYWFEVWQAQAGGSRMSWNWNYAPVQSASGSYGSWQTNYGTFPNGNYNLRATVNNVTPSGDPAPPSWAYTGASGYDSTIYLNSIAYAPNHPFTVLSETMPSPSVNSYDFQKDLNGNPTWGAAQGTAANFVLGNAGNGNTAGYSYAFDSGGTVNSVDNNTCNYSSQTTSGGATYGLIPDSSGSATLAMPAGLSVGHHTLYVKSFDAAHNMSPNATVYEFFVSPNYNVSQTKFEAEDTKSVALSTALPPSPPAGATAPTTLVQTGSAGTWSGGGQVLFTGHEIGDTYSMTFTSALDADYAIGLNLTRAPDYGKLKIDIDGTILNNTDTMPFDGYAPNVTTGFFAGGARLSAGAHKVTLTVVGTNPATANSATKLQYQAGVDYIKAVPVNNATFPSFAAAMNNHGISDDSAPGAADFDYNSRNVDGDVGGTVGTGYSLSKQALAAVNLASGTSFTMSGLNFTMPAANSAGNDNVVAMGQTITLDKAQQIPASAVGLLVASTCGTTPQSQATIGYTASGPAADTPYTSPIPDWVAGTPTTDAFNPRYVNTPSGAGNNPARVYLMVLPANPGATLQRITLPNYGTTMVPGTCPVALHVLAIGVRPAATANAATTADTSGGNHPLSVFGTVGYTTDHGGAAVFDTTSGSVLKTGAPILDTTKSFSVSAWAKLPPGVTNGVVASQDGVNSSSFMLYVSSAGTWKFAMPIADANGWNADQVETPQAAPTNVWSHLVATYDAAAGSIALYVNGTLVGAHPHTNAWGATGPFVIGRDKYSGTYNAPFGGSISDVQVYQRALSASDVSTLFGTASPGALAAPAGVWPLTDFGRVWTGAWGSVPTTGAVSQSGNIFAGQTIRQTVHPTTSGSGADAKVRIRLGNSLDLQPVTITTATIAVTSGAGSAGVKTAVPLTFGGPTTRSVTIEPYAEVYSDPIPVSQLGATGDLTVSLYLAGGAFAAPEAPRAGAVGFTAAGDQTADTAGSAATWTPLAAGATGWYFVDGVDFTSTDTTQGSVVVLGDRTAISPSATVPTWVDDTPGALAAAGQASPGGFVNLSSASASAAGVANSLGQRVQNWWRLSDRTGTIGSATAGGSALTMTGTTWSGDHPNSTTGSAAFTGTGSYASASGPIIDTTQSFTVSAWAKTTTTDTANHEVVSVEGTTNSAFAMGYTGGTGGTQTWWAFMPGSDTVGNSLGSMIVAPAGSAQPNAWTHLTAVYDAGKSTLSLYVNGVLKASGQSAVAPFKASGPLTVGRSLWGGNQVDYWPGNIADVQVYQEPLPAGDVANLPSGGADLQAGDLLNAGPLDEANPRTVVLALGANDLVHGDTPALIEANLRAIALDIKTGLKKYKGGAGGTSPVSVIVETVPPQSWSATNTAAEAARVQLNKDLLNGAISGIDGIEDAAGAAASATSSDPATVNQAIATRLANDVAGFAISL
jgi:hypothetical protein